VGLVPSNYLRRDKDKAKGESLVNRIGIVLCIIKISVTGTQFSVLFHNFFKKFRSECKSSKHSHKRSDH